MIFFQHAALQYQALPKAKYGIFVLGAEEFPHLSKQTGRMNLSNANTVDILSDMVLCPFWLEQFELDIKYAFISFHNAVDVT